jgi:formylglycine-generating enzyme required for sulfatase activity/uncharacterized caspase-like protein
MADERDVSTSGAVGPEPRRGPRASAGGPWRTDAYAVVIGINSYVDPKIPDLRFAREDAEAVYQVLTDPEVGRFKPEHVALLLDGEATQRNIRSALGTKLPRQAPRESTVCIYYAGHGAPEIDTHHRSSDGVEKYLVPHDAQADDLWSSGISMEAVQQIFSRLSANQVVCFLDCCYSGAAGGRSFEREGFQTRALLSDEFLDSLASEGRLVVTACATNEVSLESQEKGHGLFTYHLVKGLQGAADADGNGLVTVDELYDYVYHQVERDARSMGGSMRPVRRGSVRGRVYLTEYETPRQKQIRLAHGRAAAAWARGDVDEAELSWNEVIAADPVHDEARAGLARITERRAREQAARDEAARAKAEELRRRHQLLQDFFERDELSPQHFEQALQLLEQEPAALAPLDRRRRKYLDNLLAGALTPKAYRLSMAALEAAREGEPVEASGKPDRRRDEPAVEPPIQTGPKTSKTAQPETQAPPLESAFPQAPEVPPAPPSERRVRFNPAAWNLPDDESWGFVEIPKGPFMRLLGPVMGSDKKTDPDAHDDELPQHSVMLPAYWIGRYEVTVGQFKACVADGGCVPVDKRALDGPDDLPVRHVSWHEALAYCDWIDKKLRGSSATPRHIANALATEGYRITLPSEAEWEHAARGSNGRRYPWGNAAVDSTRANYDSSEPVAVGSLPAGRTPEGVCDLAGNVWEWTRSLYKPYPYEAADGRERLGGSALSLLGGEERVLRGGSFISPEDSLRAARRGRSYPGNRDDNFGFRLVSSRLRP